MSARPYSVVGVILGSRRLWLKTKFLSFNAMKAIVEGIHHYKADKEQALKVISKYMKIQDREVLEESFRAYDFALKPYPSKEYFELPIQEVARRDPKVLKENPERFADSSLLKELDESGFIDRLTREYGLKK